MLRQAYHRNVMDEIHSWSVGSHVRDFQQGHHAESGSIARVAARVEEVSRDEDHVEDLVKFGCILNFVGCTPNRFDRRLEDANCRSEFFAQ